MHQGKYGYYVCDRETFEKARLLKKAFWQEVYQAASWRRWANKKKESPEPKINHFFSHKEKRNYKYYPKYNTKKNYLDKLTKFSYLIFNKEFTLFVDDRDILKIFEVIRKPYKTKEEIEQYSNYTEIINRMFEEHRKVSL